MKLAVVTGGTRGLGAALCAHYVAAGWEVIEFSRSARLPFSVRADLTDPRAAQQAFSQTFATIVGSDLTEVVAYNNAAMIGPVGPVENLIPAEINAHMNVNVVSAVVFACAFFAAFRDHACPKTFVNISSGAATRGLAGWSLYCARKAAMENYVRAVSLEQERKEHPIRAISVNPGVMDTSMQEEVRNAPPEDFPDVRRYVDLHAEGRLADPRDVGARIARLVAARPEPGQTYSVRDLV